MFVFPANDEGYRKRKRAHKACEQCKRRRKRCDFPLGSVRCEPCAKADILCSLAPEFELAEKASRLDPIAQQNINTAASPAPPSPQQFFKATKASRGESSSSPKRPPLGGRTSSGSSIHTRTTLRSVQNAVHSNASKNNGSVGGSNGGGGAATTAAAPSRPPLGPRATSFNPSHLRSNGNGGSGGSGNGGTVDMMNGMSSAPSPPRPTSAHKRTNSHSPSTLAAATADTPPNLSPLNGPTSAPTPQPGAQIDSESIGVWVKSSSAQQRLNPHLYTYLASINAFSMPLRPNREALIDLYCESIDCILPLLDRNQFVKLHSIGQAPTLLLHAVLLVAARHPRASQYLGNQSVRQFCAATAFKIRALLYAEVEQDRLTLVRIYALLSLHSEGPDGLENSCGDLQKAIHYAISLGIHHEKPFVDRDEMRRLWWALWCMDRISGCVNARPLICNLQDVGSRMITKEEHNNLGRLVELCYKLEQVIYLYRPRAPPGLTIPKGVDELFEGDDTYDPFQAMLALLHHTTVILAHKRMNSSQERRGMEEENVVIEAAGMTAPTSQDVPNFRRTLGAMSTPLTMVLAEEKMKRPNMNTMGPIEEDSTATASSSSARIKTEDSPGSDDSIIANFQSHFLNNDSHEDKRGSSNATYDPADSDRTDILLLSSAGSIIRILKTAPDLPPLPIVPYCASLTLTVFLRTYPRFDTETGFTWKDSCAVLESMADRWWVAGAMGSMGWNVFRTLEDDSRKEHERQEELKRQHQWHQHQQHQQEQQRQQQERQRQQQAQQQQHQLHNQHPLQMEFDDPFANDFEVPMEEQFLDMFSDLPNQTSFIDQALTLESFNDVEPWLEEKKG
uniref:ARAD1A00462p n=1 Tax=Blastobotrys adeninivorans TaxID=409370 RepID=A0A060SWB6_BLAAD